VRFLGLEVAISPSDPTDDVMWQMGGRPERRIGDLTPEEMRGILDQIELHLRHGGILKMNLGSGTGRRIILAPKD
jgi:hypothetical protein